MVNTRKIAPDQIGLQVSIICSYYHGLGRRLAMSRKLCHACDALCHRDPTATTATAPPPPEAPEAVNLTARRPRRQPGRRGGGPHVPATKMHRICGKTLIRCITETSTEYQEFIHDVRLRAIEMRETRSEKNTCKILHLKVYFQYNTRSRRIYRMKVHVYGQR